LFSDLSKPWIIGHRGAAGEAPENSLAGVRKALELDVDMIELDIQLTADGVPLVVHDWDLQRLAGAPLVIETADADDALRMRLAPSSLPGEQSHRIPRLQEVLHLVPDTFRLNLEIKRRQADRETLVQALARLLADRENLLVSSFDWDLLTKLRQELPAAAFAPLAKRGWRGLLEAGRRLEAFSLHCHWRMARPALIAAARADGRPVFVYTVNSVDAAVGHLRRGVQGMFTDFPGRLRGLAAIS
jgi:glycerophosphoryl diester phosphodiesterase